VILSQIKSIKTYITDIEMAKNASLAQVRWNASWKISGDGWYLIAKHSQAAECANLKGGKL